MDEAEILGRLAAATSAGDQLEVLQAAWGCAGMVELSLSEAEAIHVKLGKATSRQAQLDVLRRCREERQAACAFDVALAPLAASQPQVRQLANLLKANGATITGTQLAHWLDHLTSSSDSFLSAAQASQIMGHADSAPQKMLHKLHHVVCARVVDRWNLTKDAHTEVACYYGWDGGYLVQLLQQALASQAEPEAAEPPSVAALQALVLSEQSQAGHGEPPVHSRKLQNRVLALMGKGGHTAESCAWSIPGHAARIIARNFTAGSSGTVDDCAICLDPCQNGTALWTCGRCKHQLHQACHDDWARSRKRQRDEDSDDEPSEEAAPCPYCRHKNMAGLRGVPVPRPVDLL